MGDSTYQLTPNASGKTGSVWDSTLLKINQRFDISFNLRFGCNNNGGKGIAFVLHNDVGGFNELATDPESMGYLQAIDNSMAIEFDTENDNLTNEVGYDHLAVHLNGQQGSPLVKPRGILTSRQNVENCKLYRVRVSYSPAISTLTIYVNCVLVAQKKVDLVNDVFFGTKEVYMGFTASNGSNGNAHLVEYLGETKNQSLDFTLDGICPDTLVFDNEAVRQEYSNFKWTIIKKGQRLDSIYGYEGTWEAPEIGNYNVELQALRACDSLVIKETKPVEAIDSVEVLFSFDIDTACSEYNFRINTSCYNCDQLKWDFEDQNTTWGFPNQILNLTKNQDFRGYFTAAARQGNCLDRDSQFFNLYILDKSAPKLWLSDDTLCGGETLSIVDSVSGMDSVVFNFTNGFGLKTESGNRVDVTPTGFGKLQIARSIYYPQGCTFSDTVSVQIDTLPQAIINVDDSSKSCDLVSYRFEDESVFAEGIEWFYDGDSFSDDEVEFDADTSLPIKVILVATNGGCSDTAEWETRPVIHYAPQVSLTADTVEGCSPLRVEMKWRTDPIDSFYIDFDNGTDSSGAGSKHNWGLLYRTGRYDVEYTTYSGDGNCENTVRLDEFITVYDSVVARMYIEKLSGCSPFRLQAQDSSYMEGSALKEYFFSIRQKDTIDFEQVFWTNDVNRTLENEGKYFIYYAVSNGFCADTTSYTLDVRSLLKTDVPDIYGVTVNDKQQVELSWHPLDVASKYHIKRVDNLGDEARFLAYPDTLFIDSETNTSQLEYTYTVVGADDCGSLSSTSIESKTILLTGEVSDLQEVDLNWTNYQQFSGGILNYEIDDLGQNQIVTSENSYKDEQFYKRWKPDTGKCYRVLAYENGGDEYVSSSNIVCFNPIAQVYFPTAFTPNSGGLNDTFLWRGAGIKQAHVVIFNRWGTQVYEGEGEWNGTFENRDCEDGLYYFVANFVAASGRPFTKTGQFHLIR